MANNYDVVVVGGGPGGYVAAIRAAQLGLNTALIEAKHLGGICLNWGCIPTKALLKGAEVAHTLHNLAQFGFSADNIQFDLNKLVKHSRDTAGKLTSGIEFLMKKNNITVIMGHAKLVDKGVLSVTENSSGERKVSGTHIILATGARPRNLSGITADGDRIWTYFEAMVPETLPTSLLVIGSGAIGVEFASFYNDLGVDVTLVEVMDQVMPIEDPEVSAFAQKSFKKRGIKVMTNTMVTGVDKHADSITCELQGKDDQIESVTVERVILAAGIQANIEELGLETLGVETEKGFIKIDEWCRTNVVWRLCHRRCRWRTLPSPQSQPRSGDLHRKTGGRCWRTPTEQTTRPRMYLLPSASRQRWVERTRRKSTGLQRQSRSIQLAR